MASGEPQWYMDMILAKGKDRNSFLCPHCNQPISIGISQSTFFNSPQVLDTFISPTHIYDQNKSWFDKLPDVLDVGKTVEIISDSTDTRRYKKRAKIIDHYISQDHCGPMGKAMYLVQFESDGEKCSYSVGSCQIVD